MINKTAHQLVGWRGGGNAKQCTKFLALAVSEIFQNQLFCDGEVGVDSGGANAICSQPELAGGIISGRDVYLSFLRLCKRADCKSSPVFKKIKIHYICYA